MKKTTIHWKTLTAVTAALGIFAAGALGHGTKPHSVIVTVKWNIRRADRQGPRRCRNHSRDLRRRHARMDAFDRRRRAGSQA